ncbi:MAG TPA: hypothetical protein VGA78_12755 [Gemmatimonadales bacterium]
MHIRYVVLLAAAFAGCGEEDPAPGELVVEWAGHEHGRFVAPLAATHCAATGVVELIAIRGDTGLASALFLSDSTDLRTGDYPIFLAATAPEPRPGAVAALRWFNLTSIVAYEGLSGIVHVEPGEALLSGRFDVKLQGIDQPDTLRVTGRFDGVPLAQGDSTCSRTMRRNTL